MGSEPKPPMRCPSCRSANPADAKSCEMCGYVFEPHKQSLFAPRETAPKPQSQPQPQPQTPEQPVSKPVEQPKPQPAQEPVPVPVPEPKPEPVSPPKPKQQPAATQAKVIQVTPLQFVPAPASRRSPTKPMPLQPRRSRLWPAVSLAVVALAAVAGVLVALNGLSNGTTSPIATATATSLVTVQALAPLPTVTEPPASPPATAVSEPATPIPPPTGVVVTDTPASPAQAVTPEAPTPEPPPTAELPTPTAEAKVITYTVVAGDSCYAIFQRFDIPIEDIIRINKLSVNCFIQPGNVLIVSK